MLDDAAFAAALRSASSGGYTVTGVQRLDAPDVLLEFQTRQDGRRWAVVLPLPSAPQQKPWQHRVPDDEADSVQMLSDLLDEAIRTSSIYTARASMEEQVTVVELAPYGIRVADQHEHARRSAAERLDEPELP